ncbi:MAG: hypothetical protein EAZ89_13075 [Bacteroidetes bacterium]|nr:MAG: hypothetical protein EAZ89_13075 [Bacteroidota bacterium]
MRICFLIGSAALLLWLSACERPVNPVEEGVLTFSSDTVKFDSIFTTFLSPSERLIVHNETGRDVKIARVWLESGTNSEFEMIVDGIEGRDVQDIVIANNDSAHIFINLKSALTDSYTEEYLAFQVGSEIQRVLLRARVIDAYFLRARVAQEGDILSLTPESFFFRNDTILNPDKPIVIDGPVFIPEGVTVTIMPGTELFFTPYKFGVKDSTGVPTFGFYSMLIVDGTLKAEGLPGSPVVFQGSRFDSVYQENPAQWRGLWVRKESRDNVLRHCRIKNAQIGLEVDSVSVNSNPKVLIQYTEIKNMGVHGIAALSFAAVNSGTVPTIKMENSVVNSCKLHTLWAPAGGRYEFSNCTFANFNVSRFSRRTPQLLAGNWWSFDGVSAVVYPSYIDFFNCIIWGSEEDEVVIDTLQGAPFERLNIERCMVRLSPENEPALRPHLLESLINQDPLFNEYFSRDYRLKAGSPAINIGLDLSTRFTDDFRGAPDTLRYDGFDIGAYEYYPIE